MIVEPSRELEKNSPPQMRRGGAPSAGVVDLGVGVVASYAARLLNTGCSVGVGPWAEAVLR
jgi:hypothetical protein